MSLPIVAIVGRPNVGKSSLFNWLAGRRISIVDPTAGVTRDRVSTVVEAGGRFFELIDTGGIGIVGRGQPHRRRRAADPGRHRLGRSRPVRRRRPRRRRAARRGGRGPAARRQRSRSSSSRTRPTPRSIRSRPASSSSSATANRIAVSADQKLGKADLLDAILEKLPPDTGEGPPGDVGSQARHRRPAQRRQEHVHQQPGRGASA